MLGSLLVWVRLPQVLPDGSCAKVPYTSHFRASTHEKVDHSTIYRHSGSQRINRLCVCESRNACLKLHDHKPYCTGRQRYIVLQPGGERTLDSTVAWFICRQGAVEHHHVSAVSCGEFCRVS
ncbi:hypothetical protein [Brasilonema bromeliae]|uniref:hypothetical protein n=1 Tax=Brasilonema bromeliae TaxID=383615 RepID=UPI00145D506A|nr:hypothetical protein [Brasilonema bromeliae]